MVSLPYPIRQATERDIDILDRLHTENMQGYVERVYPWQPQLFREKFVLQEYRVLESDKPSAWLHLRQIIGFFKIVFSNHSVYLAEIQICSEYQNRGIGTELLKSIIKKSGVADW